MDVLFTCVGSTDPVRTMHDGSMLHIIRHYRPEKVFIILSHEAEETEKKDKRYTKAIDKFNKDYSCAIKKEYIYTSIRDVSDFDAFEAIFRTELDRIANENSQARILLNISSGTPQMQTTLCLLATNPKYNTLAVQVKTPANAANKSDTAFHKNYDVDCELELNEDNNPTSPNRCVEPQIFGLRRALAREQIISFLKSYNYTAAKKIVKDYGFGSNIITLLNHLIDRQNLNEHPVPKETLDGFKLYPIEKGRCRHLTEAYLILQNLQKTHKYTDFVLRLNPLIVELQKEYLLKKTGFDLKKFCNKQGVLKDLLYQYDQSLTTHMKKFFSKELYEISPISIWLLNGIIDYYKTQNSQLIDDAVFFNQCEKLNQAERNPSAHSIYALDEKNIEASCGLNSTQILNKIKQLLLALFPRECKKEIFTFYDETNSLLEEML